MNILGVQIIAVLFAIFMLYVAFLHWKRKDINGGEILFWGTIWLGFIIVTLFPKILESISQFFFFTRILDLLMLVAFMILAFIGFQNYIANRKMEKKIGELVREETLKNDKKKKRPS